MKKGFDNDKYIKMQSEHIEERINSFGGKLYLEFGGKLFDDYHASRVLPGFEPDSKIRMLTQLKDRAEIIIVVSAAAIEQNKIRGDLGITYDMDTLRLIDAFRGNGLIVSGVVITHYASPQPTVLSKGLITSASGLISIIPFPDILQIRSSLSATTVTAKTIISKQRVRLS